MSTATAAPMATGDPGRITKSPDERKAILADRVSLLLGQGRRVEYASEFDVVLVRGHPLGHGLDRLPRFLTRLFAGEKRELVAVDESGTVTVEDE